MSIGGVTSTGQLDSVNSSEYPTCANWGWLIILQTIDYSSATRGVRGELCSFVISAVLKLLCVDVCACVFPRYLVLHALFFLCANAGKSYF